LISTVRARGLAALIATHNLELAERMDRVILMHEGKLVEGASLVR
jgi:lipoprotein-releasing system ATP-binding protein